MRIPVQKDIIDFELKKSEPIINIEVEESKIF
jgi:hypothetical protein